MKRHLFIYLILVVGFVLRVYGLSRHPAGFTPDEASFAYDAYSIINTGKDQWGNFLPTVFKSFGDYKLPLYAYISVPSIFIFGLTEFAVRLPGAIVGTLAIGATYLLATKAFNKNVGVVAAFLIAVSPWHIPLSRGAFEANLTTFFLSLGIWLFLEGKKRPILMALAGLAFGLNMFTYHSARIVTPIVVLALVVLNAKLFRWKNKTHLLAAAIFIFFSLVSVYSLLEGAAARANTSTIFSMADIIFSDRVNAVNSGEPNIIATVFNNKITFIAGKLSSNYMSYFSPKFLFTDGPAEGTYGMVPGVGVLYLFELLNLVVVLVALVRKEVKVPLWLVVWIFVAALPAAISKGPGFAANRAVVMLPALTIFSALGATIFYKSLKNLFYKRVVIFGTFLIVCLSFVSFLEDYFYQQPAKEAYAMVYGAREIMELVIPIENQFSQIIFTKNLSEPHIFVAFYKKVAPDFYQTESLRWTFDQEYDWVDQLPLYSLGKYTFRNINWPADLNVVDALIISPAAGVPEKANIVGRVNYPNGNPAYVLVDTRVSELAGD